MPGDYFVMIGDDVVAGGLSDLQQAEKEAGEHLPKNWNGERLRPSLRVSICKEIIEYGGNE